MSMSTNDIICWLRDQAKRMPTEVHKRGMIEAAANMERLSNNLKVAVAQRNAYQKKCWEEIASKTGLIVDNVAMAAELKKHGGCGSCKHCYSAWDEDPCDSCRQDPNFPLWEWKGGIDA